MRKTLDFLYGAALWLSALCLLVLAVLVAAQVGGRLFDMTRLALGMPRYGFLIPSLPEFAGFLLCTSTFLALAGTLKAGAHIRVTLFLGLLPEATRRPFEIVAFAFSALAAGYATVFVGRLALDSWRFNELSVGLVPVPLAPVQAMMVLGLALLTIAFIDEFLRVILTGRATFRAAEDAIALGKEG